MMPFFSSASSSVRSMKRRNCSSAVVASLILCSAGWGGWVGENRLGDALAGSGILGHAFFHPRELFGGRGDVKPRFPFGGGHAVDDRAGHLLVEAARLRDPVPQAVAAESGQIGRAQVCTSVTTAHYVCRLLLETKK